MPEVEAVPETVVKETAVADVRLDDDGAPSQVNGYRVISQLGEGTFSKVYHCQDGEGREYALKILNKSFLKRKREYKKIDGKMVFSNAFQKVQKEVAIMKKLAHDNLVKLQEIIDSPADDKMFLVLELITGGQVMKWEDKAFRYRCLRTASGVMKSEDVRLCMCDVVDALEYLHKNLICHRDIKPENILLAGENTYKLADFGVAHMVEDSGEKKTMRNTEGTYHFLAPECTTGEEYDPYRVDIWALGVTMFTMLFGTLPFGKKAASLTDVMDSIRVDPLEIDTTSMDAECEDLMRAMMTKDPLKRITIEELKTHPWLLKGAEPKVLSARAAPSVVEVTREEIEAAFTPVNNFILMARLKMRMASRLARARNSIDRARSKPPNEVLEGSDRHRFETFASTLAPLSPALPSLEAPSKADDVVMPVSPTAASVSSSTISSTSPGKAAMVTLARRLSQTETTVAPVLYDPVISPSDPEASPTRPALPHEPVLTKRKSAVRDKLVIQNWQLDSATNVAIERDVVTTNTILNSVSPAKMSREIEVEGSIPTARASPTRPSTMPMVGDIRLPKLDLSSAFNSPNASPVSSPVSSRPRQKLTPRFSRENLAIDLDKDDEEDDKSSSPKTQPIAKRSPTDKRLRAALLHQGVVHPAPDLSHASLSAESEDSFGDREFHGDGADQLIRIAHPPSASQSPGKRKTQDETKAAITSIITRTQGDSTSPTVSPAKESSMMLHRRKSSNTDSLYQNSHTSISNSRPLPSLMETTSGKQDRLSVQSSERPTSLKPLTDEVEKKPTATSSFQQFASKKTSPSKSRRSERSVHSERSVRSSGRASTYAAEQALADGADDVDDGCTTTVGSAHGFVPPIAESPKAAHLRRMKSRDLSLGKVPAEPTEGGEDEAADIPNSSPHSTSKLTDGKISPTLRGLFRKGSYNNVSPAETSRDLSGSDEPMTARKPNHLVAEGHESSTHSPTKDDRPSSRDPVIHTETSGPHAQSPTAQDLPTAASPVRRLFTKRQAPKERSPSPNSGSPIYRAGSVQALLTGASNLIKKGTSPTSEMSSATDSLRRQTTSPTIGLAAAAKETPAITTTLKSTSCLLQ